MGMFGKKKNKSKKELNTEPAAPAPAPAPRPQQVIKIVGDSKHITTTSIDEHGRQVTQTQIKKLTAAERQQMGLPPAPVAPPPPQAAKPAPPPPMYDDRNNNQYHNNSNQYQNNSNNNMMRTPQSLDDVRSTQSSANGGGAGSASGASTSQNLQPDDRLASIEVTRELVKRFISDIWNRGEIELIPSVCHPSLRFNGHVGMDRVGHEGFSRMVTTVRESLTDYHCEIHSMVVETNKAFCRLRFTGKHTGNLLGFPPTGKTVAWMGASEFTCKNGKILKVWELGDVKSLEEQLRSAE
mmetsp:Transcript_21643/g.33088  ORF Transcript_21643/g.33088 Transcript_21643/m.33088 type:complete len:296 (+) Transcript_21643:151-1038(+)